MYFVHRYVPVQTLKLSKLRARQITEPLRLKPKYPKKFSIKAEDSSMKLVKNDLPWTLHPLPPPLPTSKTSIKFEVEKAMPWALQPLPPPVKTKNYSDYYWPDGKARPKIVYRYKSPMKPYRFVKNYKYAGFKPSAVDPIAENVGYKPSAADRPADDKPDEYNHVDYKHVNYKHIDYNKSPDYKSEYPVHTQDEDDEERVDDDRRSHHAYSHDDYGSSDIEDSSQPPTTTEYVSHITIEPSIQIASFSETEMQGDGSTREPVSQADNGKQKCRCTGMNGHRHKRDAGVQPRNTNGTADNAITAASVLTRDSIAGRSLRNSYVAPNVGHATDVQIIRSHDITDRTVTNNPIDYVQQVQNFNEPVEPTVTRRPTETNPVTTAKAEATFRDESDSFKVDFGRDVNVRDESKVAVAGRGPRFSSIKLNHQDDNDDGGGGLAYDVEPGRGRGYHITKSKVENSDHGVAFSVQTPFSVSSFSSNVRYPGTDERRSQFRYTEHKTGSSPLLGSFQSADPHSEQPLEFEQFGFQSALFDDEPSSSSSSGSSRLTGGSHYSHGFDGKPSENVGQFTSGFSDTFNGNTPTDFSGREASHFSQGFGGQKNDNDDRSRRKPFRYDVTRLGESSSPLDRFNNRPPLGSRTSSDDSVFEYFQPVVIDFEKFKSNQNDFKSFGSNQNDKSRFFGKTDSSGYSIFKDNQKFDQLRLPGHLHESNENLSRKMLFHPSTFDID